MAEEKGIEGKQAQLLRLHLRKAVEDVTDSIPVAEIIADVPNLKKRKITEFANSFKTTIGRKLEKVVESLLQDEEMDQLLKTREELIEEQKDMEGSTAWRPSGSVVDDMRSFDMNIIIAKRKQATAMCEKVEKEVESLFSQVQEARLRAHHYKKQLVAAEEQLNNLTDFVNVQEEAHFRIADSLY